MSNKKRILLYGTGNRAKSYISKIGSNKIYGILDRSKIYGYFCGCKIIEWKEIKIGDVDRLIIASDERYYLEIFQRIRFYCDYYKLSIYTLDGMLLDDSFIRRIAEDRDSKSINICYEDVVKEIDAHDAISFDLFDTLIMRNVLSPLDIFDILQRNLKKEGISLDSFRKRRRTFELEAGGNIHNIYNKIADGLQMSHEEADHLKKLEIQCEKDHLKFREDVMKCFYYAIKSGKNVSIVSDMYLTNDILKDILLYLGVNADIDIFVSCDFGRNKRNGLFYDYMERVSCNKYLHIGDNYEADVVSANKAHIDAIWLRNGLDLYCIDKKGTAIIEPDSLEERISLGNFICRQYNSPFCISKKEA